MSGLLRVRFKTKEQDYRPVNWPIEYPYWNTGDGEDFSVIVAYASSMEYIVENWPEAYDIDVEPVDGIVFTDRFRKPDWYNR